MIGYLLLFLTAKFQNSRCVFLQIDVVICNVNFYSLEAKNRKNKQSKSSFQLIHAKTKSIDNVNRISFTPIISKTKIDYMKYSMAT